MWVGGFGESLPELPQYVITHEMSAPARLWRRCGRLAAGNRPAWQAARSVALRQGVGCQCGVSSLGWSGPGRARGRRCLAPGGHVGGFAGHQQGLLPLRPVGLTAGLVLVPGGLCVGGAGPGVQALS